MREVSPAHVLSAASEGLANTAGLKGMTDQMHQVRGTASRRGSTEGVGRASGSASRTEVGREGPRSDQGASCFVFIFSDNVQHKRI